MNPYIYKKKIIWTGAPKNLILSLALSFTAFHLFYFWASTSPETFKEKKPNYHAAKSHSTQLLGSRKFVTHVENRRESTGRSEANSCDSFYLLSF